MRDSLLVLGDSVTVGAGFSGVDERSSYVSLLQERFRRAAVDVQLNRSAIDGVDTGYALRRFDRMVGRFQPDVVVVALGLNDAQPPGGRDVCDPVQYEENLCRMAEKILELDAHPVLATPSPRIDVPGRRSEPWQVMEPYAERVQDVAGRFGVPAIDVFGKFVSRGRLESLLPDRLHPGPEGHRLIADAFAETLVPMCRDRGGDVGFDDGSFDRPADCEELVEAVC